MPETATNIATNPLLHPLLLTLRTPAPTTTPRKTTTGRNLLSFSGHDVAAKHPCGGEARGTKDGVGLLVGRGLRSLVSYPGNRGGGFQGQGAGCDDVGYHSACVSLSLCVCESDIAVLLA